MPVIDRTSYREGICADDVVKLSVILNVIFF